jgi:hypothetical protein
MKNIILQFVLSFLFIGAVSAQGFIAKTGDTDFDQSLANIDANAKADLSKFKKELSMNFHISLPRIDQLLLKIHPAEVYLACEIGKLSGKPVDNVVEAYEANKGQGWGVIAKQMGIKPGSPEFHALKNSAKGKSMKSKGNSNSKGSGNNQGHGKGKSNGHGH